MAGIGFASLRVSAMHLRGHDVGPALRGLSCANQRLEILLGVGKHSETDGVGLAWLRTPENCAELEGVGGG